MKINLLRGLIAILTALAVLFGCHRVLLLKSEDGISQCESLYKQKKDSIDVLLLGSSRIFCNVRTGILWDEYGFSSYDLGGAETPTWTSYYHLKEALRNQHPKVVVFEVSVSAIRPALFPPIFWIEDNIYGMRWSMDRIRLTKMQTYEENFKKTIIPLSVMHDRYRELTKNDFIDQNNSINYKGFDEREGIHPVEAPDILGVTERTPIEKQAEDYLRKIIQLCKDEQISLLFIVAPYSASAEDQSKYNYIFDIADEEDVPYIDFNQCYQEYDMDYSTDMTDEFHLNASGTVKFSKYLGGLLKDRYELQDHRGDKNYVSWEKDALLQRQQINEVELRNAESTGKYLLAMLNEQYLVYVSLGPGVEGCPFYNDNHMILNRLGITEETFQSDNNLIVSNGNLLYASMQNQQRAFIDQKDMNLLLTRETDEDSFNTILRINENEYDLNTDGIKFIVYDKALKKVVSEKEFDL